MTPFRTQKLTDCSFTNMRLHLLKYLSPTIFLVSCFFLKYLYMNKILKVKKVNTSSSLPQKKLLLKRLVNRRAVNFVIL